ncbi:hypothetical protein LJC04_05015 [Ruminococcaceae bacterium OttesenSCG-928-O06]|nr:hypothetical protein [Ruminococcaceae bacterium OttesenSCG-928-O06]
MGDLSKEYSLLFNGITDALRELERISNRLKYLQQQAEESYLAQGDEVEAPPCAAEEPPAPVPEDVGMPQKKPLQ